MHADETATKTSQGTPPIPADQPLSGIRVVDLSRYLPGPFCTLQLAQLGAEVTTIEQPPGGDPMRLIPPHGPHGESLASAALARGKQQLLVDLRNDVERAAVLERIAAADVVVESFRPGVAERLGVGPEYVRGRFPHVVYCSLSGYGQTGPWAQRAGHDANYEAVSGMLDRTGPVEHPVLPPVPLADLAGGAMAATAICAALVRRATTGDGTHIDISLTEAALTLQSHVVPAAHTAEGVRGHGLLNGDLASYGVYVCADERWLAVAPIEPKFFARLCELVGCEHLVPLQYDPSQQELIRSDLELAFQTRSAGEWQALLAHDETCVQLVLSLDEATRHEQLVARGAFEQLFPHDDPTIVAPAAPYVFDGSRSGQR